VEKQLPQYLKTEKIVGGYYLCVGFTDADFTKERLDRVRDTCKALAKEKGVKIEPIFVDARHDNKPSASNSPTSTWTRSSGTSTIADWRHSTPSGQCPAS
jgi:hypothetical protein